MVMHPVHRMKEFVYSRSATFLGENGVEYAGDCYEWPMSEKWTLATAEMVEIKRRVLQANHLVTP
jgi:hypothetical protein